jgi:hypothetical protein
MPTEPRTDPLRARVEAILRESRGRVWIADRRGISDLDPETAADALMSLVGPLVAACRAMVSSLAGFSDAYNFGADDEAALEAGRAALAAIDGPAGAERE